LKPTIIVADSIAADRAAFRTMLKDSAYDVVGEAAHGDDLLAAAVQHKPWCVACDILLPGHADNPADGGLAAMKRVLGKLPKTKILVIHSVESTMRVMDTLKEMQAGTRVRKPFKRDSLIDSLAKLSTGQEGEKSVQQLSVRLKKALVVHYKGQNEGWFAKKRDAVTTDISDHGVGIQSAEKFPKGTILNLEIELPGEAPVKAKCQVQRVEHVAGLPRYDVGMTVLEMDASDRERYTNFIRRILERGTGVIKAK